MTNAQQSKVLYWLMGAVLTVASALCGIVYTSLHREIARIDVAAQTVAAEQVRHTARLATLDTKTATSEDNGRKIETQLTRIEAELIGLRLLVAALPKHR